MKEFYSLPQSAELVAEIDAIAHRHGSREQIFDDFLTMAVCALAGGTREEEYLQVVKPYCEGQQGKRSVDRLATLFADVVRIMDETRADLLGDIFQGAITRGQHGQFFTPDPICELMARLADHDEPGKTVCDPCCGSGRILLAAAEIDRNRFFVGQDTDLRCVKITAINLALWNLYGRVIWGNSLTNDRKRVYETGFDGKGVIRVIETTQAANSPPVSPSMDADDSEASEVAPTATPAESPVQGTLFDGLD